MSNDMKDILQELRMQLAKRGGAGIRTLGLAFSVNDKDHNGSFDINEFEQVLSRVGLFLKKQDLSRCFRYFDTNKDDKVSYQEFLIGLQGELNERRTNIVRQAFDKLDKDRSGIVDVKDITGVYSAKKHPEVLAGKKTEEQILHEFLSVFEGAGGNHDGKVTFDEFKSYYSEISASVPYDDDYFVLLMEHAWDIKETTPSEVANELVKKIQNILKQKIYQKTKTRGSEPERLRSAFKHFDNDGSGSVGLEEFQYALERFGLLLEEKVSRALFASFDVSGNGRVNYAEFSSVMYQDALLGPLDQTSNTNLLSTLAKKDPESKSSTLRDEKKSSKGNDKPVVVFVLGGPGCGKGTQCQRIVNDFGFVHLSAGDLLREEKDKNEMISNYIKEGKIVPVEITVGLIKNAIDKHSKEGKTHFLVDGFPRNKDNLDGWEKTMGASVDVPFILFFDCPEDVMEKRILSRNQGRIDDNKQTIKKRFATFQNETMAVIKKFSDQGKVRTVSALGTPNQVFGDVTAVISTVKSKVANPTA